MHLLHKLVSHKVHRNSYFSLWFGQVKQISERWIKNVPRKAHDITRALSIKFFFFYIISFILLVVFWYYISCFCAVYKNTQYHLIKDTLIGFGTSILYPLALELLIPLLRIPSLKGYSKVRLTMYKFSQMLLFF